MDTTLSSDIIQVDKQLQSFQCKIYKFFLAMLVCTMMMVDFLLLTQQNTLDFLIYAVSTYADGPGSKKLFLGVLASLIIQGGGNMLYAIHVKSYRAAKGSIAIFSIATFGVMMLVILHPFHVPNYQFDPKLPYVVFGATIVVLLLCIFKGLTISRLFAQKDLLLADEFSEQEEDREKANFKDEDAFKVNEILRFLMDSQKLEQYSHIYYRTFLILILLLTVVYEIQVILYLLPSGPRDIPTLSQLLFSSLAFILGTGCFDMLRAMHKKSYAGVRRAKIAFKIYNVGSILMIILALCPMDKSGAKGFMVLNWFFITLAYFLVPILGYFGAVAVEKTLRSQEAVSIVQFLLEQKLIAHVEQVELVRDQVQELDKVLEKKRLRIYNWWLYLIIFLTLYSLEQIVCGVELIILSNSLDLVWFITSPLMTLMQILQIYGCTMIAIGFEVKNGKIIEKAILALKINLAGLLIFGMLYYLVPSWSPIINIMESNSFALLYYLVFESSKLPTPNSLFLYLNHCFVQISCFVGIYYLRGKVLEREGYCHYIKSYIPMRFHTEAV